MREREGEGEGERERELHNPGSTAYVCMFRLSYRIRLAFWTMEWNVKVIDMIFYSKYHR